jgi:2-iminobutanoate/2-iminopropanoate deaminase
MIERVVLPPYDTFDLSTFVIQGDTVHIGHFGGLFDHAGNKLSTIEEQTVQAFKNLENALTKVNLTLENMLKVTVVLRDISDFHAMHRAWKQIFQSTFPCRTTITSDFIDEDCLIQIDGVAGIQVPE